MNKLLILAMLTLGCGTLYATTTVPEIDPVSGASALAFIAGAVILYRGRRGK